jgi:hypothetical protein
MQRNGAGEARGAVYENTATKGVSGILDSDIEKQSRRIYRVAEDEDTEERGYKVYRGAERDTVKPSAS